MKLAPNLFKGSLLNIAQFFNRRNNAKLLFVFDVLSGRIDPPKLLSLFDINIPPRLLRNCSFYRLGHHRTNYGSFEPVRKFALAELQTISKMNKYNLTQNKKTKKHTRL